MRPVGYYRTACRRFLDDEAADSEAQPHVDNVDLIHAGIGQRPEADNGSVRAPGTGCGTGQLAGCIRRGVPKSIAGFLVC